MYLVFDTETTGLPKNFNAPITDLDNWPRLVQLSWQLHEPNGKLVEIGNYIVKPDGFTIPYNAAKVHGITTERAEAEGVDLQIALDAFKEVLQKTSVYVGHNIGFDEKIMGAEFYRAEMETNLHDLPFLDTKDDGTEYCKIPGGRGGGYKWPTLTELHEKLFGTGFDAAHNAAFDVDATARCFFEMMKVGASSPEGVLTPDEIKYEAPDLNHLLPQEDETDSATTDAGATEVKTDELIPFSHLHVHTQFSMLQSTANIKGLIAKAKEDGMKAIAITDHGSLFSAFNAVSEGVKQGVQVIIGCEVYVVDEEAREKKQFTKDNRDRRYPVVLLAKNQEGYKNLCKISSIGFVDGYYDGLPRVSKEIIQQHKEHLIVLSGNVKSTRKAFSSPIADYILNVGETQAEEEFTWWANEFGEDFYVELCRHGLEEEDVVNDWMLKTASKHGVKAVAGNNVYYINKEDGEAHDALLCIDSGDDLITPVGRGRGFRFGMANHEYYLKTQKEMNELFADLPEALQQTNEIIAKCEPIVLRRDVLMPKFPIPEGMTEDDYLRELTYEGAKKRYPDMDQETKDRIDFELKVIKDMGFPGYFLIVQDFIREARYELGVAVGPGRGSAAGSVVAYCIEITNIDPIKYNLLFERFLNPERVSMPDIDIDFDDEGRGKVIEYTIDKYGKNQVAHIVTYGTMAAKSSIRDVGRVMKYPLGDTDYLAKLVPEVPGMSLSKAFGESDELKKIRDDKESEAGKVLKLAQVLEGSVRHRGIHAAGVIIAPDDLLEYIPVCSAKDADLLVTQFDGRVIEDAGMLKMDFLGLKTLSIIKDGIKNVKARHGVEIDPDEIPLDDVPTYELYQRGDTIGTFQFESEGMRNHLKSLKPTNIEDLIAMNALYRPGPMDYIPSFIDRKHGVEEVAYPHEWLREILEPTYGIMVYQEQIMQTAQIIGGFSLGKADILRRAMGKKKHDVMQEMKLEFVEGAEAKGVEKDNAEEIFDIMAKFASYGFNRSHSAAYSVVAFQTGYLKANYTAEYMAAVLTHNMNDIKQVNYFLSESRRLGVPVLGPDVNESNVKFTVNDKGEIRYALSAIKGVGTSAVEALVEEREKGGSFSSIFELTKRCNLKSVNKKTLESLASAGAFDCFEGTHRASYFAMYPDNLTVIERSVKFGNSYQQDLVMSSNSLFGDSLTTSVVNPEIPKTGEWSLIERLKIEKEHIGIFLTGHPLDNFKVELQYLKNRVDTTTLDGLKEGQEVSMGGVISAANHRTNKRGDGFGFLTFEDYEGQVELALFSENYRKNQHLLQPDTFVYIKGKNKYNEYRKETRFEIASMGLLSQVMEQNTRPPTLKVFVPRLTGDLVNELEKRLLNSPGKHTLKMVFVDEEVDEDETKRMYDVPMSSKTIKIDLNNELCEFITASNALKYELS